jgi:hypothetical protein
MEIMMDIAVQVAIIGALFTFFAALLATLVNFYRERSEREKWQRAQELEERRIRHEENKWALELNNWREMELYKMRLRTYPEVFSVLERLSLQNIDQLNENELTEIIEKLNKWGYGEPGLCMLPDTRDAIWVLRDYLKAFAQKKVSAMDIRKGPRTDMSELMRRDLSHDPSRYRDYNPLIDINRKRIQNILEGKEIVE